jgi:hypothetical protein
MALWLSDNQVVKIWKIEDKGKYSEVQFSSSRKDGENWKNSGWGFVRFVGKAHTYLSENVSEKDRVTLKKAYFVKEDYLDEDGKKQYPKFPQLVVFECELSRSESGGGSKPAKKESKPVKQEEDDSDEIPF